MENHLCKIANRDDLAGQFKELPFEEIDWMMLKGPKKLVETTSIVMFVDKDLRTKILKNRVGHAGEVKACSKRLVDSMESLKQSLKVLYWINLNLMESISTLSYEIRN